MNAERLLAHYERIAAAPNAIARLRRFVLDLAARGKLVSQDASDEPASELMNRIKRERVRREKLKTIKHAKLQYGPIALDAGFGLPSKWAKATLGETCDLQTGATPDRSRPEYFGGDIRWLVSGDINRGEIFDCEGRITKIGLDSSNCKILPQNSVLIALNGQGKTRATVALLRTQAACNQSLVAIIPLLGADLTAEYVHLSLKARYIAIRELTGKDERRGLNMRLLECIEIAVPPVAEQLRIVAKVDELMGLCDRLEAARTNREATRDRLVTASLVRLNAPDSETFRADARFALDALPALTARADQIKALRQTILDLAVRGKLVPQDTNDEPASDLLKRIEKEKARLVKVGDIRKQAQFEPETKADGMFKVPESWKWVPATYPAYLVSDLGKKIQTKDVLETGHFPVVDQGKVFIRGYCNDASKVISVKEPLILFGDHTRETKLIDFDFVVGADGVKLLQPVCILTKYYFLALQWLPLNSRGYGRHFKLLRAAHLPLPPLAEQHRIVAKTDALMALCDQLEASLAATVATRRRLLDALLAEALAPTDARELEAAQ